MVLKQLVEHHSSANVKDYCELQFKERTSEFTREVLFLYSNSLVDKKLPNYLGIETINDLLLHKIIIFK